MSSIKTVKAYMVSEVTLKRGKGGPHTGDMPGGYYWHIYNGDVRVGFICINMKQTSFKTDTHPIYQIFLNKGQTGKGIGTEAIRQMLEEVPYKDIYGYVKKSNKASLKAAEKNGFKIIINGPQLVVHLKR